jgi:benzoyl-CoA reductase/2-hydroxyglutaryl-CoA dehydratase subunit BcrC/BadD/HgdB
MTAELLELCGFAPEEIETEMPRVEKAFQMLGLTAEDIARGKGRIRRYFDHESLGVRELLGVSIKELVDLVLAKGEKKKLLYPTVPTLVTEVFTAAMLHSEEVHPANPGIIFMLTMGAIFDKLDHILEAAERLWLAPGEGHCGYAQTELGLNALGLIPKASLCVATGFPCDELSKSHELLSEVFGIPMHWVNRCQDRDWQEPMNSRREIEFLTSEVERVIKKVGEAVGFELTEEMLVKAERYLASGTALEGEVLALFKSSDPPPASSTIVPHLHLAAMATTRRAKEEGARATATLLEELRHRGSQGIGPVPKGAPRILEEVWPNYSDPGVTRLLEELGLAVVVFESELYEPDGRLSPDIRRFDRFAERMAARTAQRSYFGNYRIRANAIIGACNRFDLDGIFWFNHPPCRYYGTDAWLIKDIVRKELDIPFLIVEGDFFDPRPYSLEQLRPKLETFAEMAKGYKKAKSPRRS